MSERAQDHTTTYDDGKFIRTAIVVQDHNGSSFDLVDEYGERLCLINAFVMRDDDGNMTQISVDVIDIDEKFKTKRALTFNDGQRQFLDAGNLVCASFLTE